MPPEVPVAGVRTAGGVAASVPGVRVDRRGGETNRAALSGALSGEPLRFPLRSSRLMMPPRKPGSRYGRVVSRCRSSSLPILDSRARPRRSSRRFSSSRCSASSRRSSTLRACFSLPSSFFASSAAALWAAHAAAAVDRWLLCALVKLDSELGRLPRCSLLSMGSLRSSGSRRSSCASAAA